MITVKLQHEGILTVGSRQIKYRANNVQPLSRKTSGPFASQFSVVGENKSGQIDGVCDHLDLLSVMLTQAFL